MIWHENYRFIYHIKELTPTEKAILIKMFNLANGFEGKFTFKFKEVNISKEIRTKAKAKLLKLNIIKKINKPFYYQIQAKDDWLIDKKAIFIWYQLFDKAYCWLDYTNLTPTQKTVFVRIVGSVPTKAYEVRKKQNTLAKELNVSKKTIQRTIKFLIEKGFIEKTHTNIEKAMHRPAKFRQAPIIKLDKSIFMQLPKDIKMKLINNFIKDYEADFGEINKKGLIRGDTTIQKKVISGILKRFDFVPSYEKNILSWYSFQEYNNSNLLLSSSSRNINGDSITKKQKSTLNKSLFKNKSNNLVSIKKLNNILDQKNINKFVEKKELINIINNLVKDNINNKDVDASCGRMGSDSEAVTGKCNKNKSKNNKSFDQDKNNKSLLRNKLHGAHNREAEKFRKKIEVKPSTKTASILNRWYKLCADYPKIYVCPKKDQKNKTYREIVDALNKLFRSTLYQTNKVILPEGMKPFKHKFTLKEMETFLDRLHIQMVDPNVGVNPFGKRKANLKEFLLGNPRTGAASKLLSCCWKEPVALKIKNQEAVKALKSMYRDQINPEQTFTFKDLQAFDRFADWSEPFTKQLQDTFKGSTGFKYMTYKYAIESARKVVGDKKIRPSILGQAFIMEMAKKKVIGLGYKL